MFDKKERPECYGSYDNARRCGKCALLPPCKRLTGKKNSPLLGLSRARAMRAFCYECNGGTSHAPDCEAPACPLYPWRNKSEKEPSLWWMGAASTWNEASQRARGATVIVGNAEDADEVFDVDEDFEEEED